MNKIKLLSVLISLFSLGLINQANAGPAIGGGGTTSPTIGTVPGGASSSSGIMNVTATVTPSCTLSANPLNFGSITLNNSSATASSTVTFNCTKDISYNINMDGGVSYDGVSRYMIGSGVGADKLAYNISFSGNNIPVNASFLSGNGLGSSSSITIQGSLSTNQLVSADSYKDTVVVSIVY